MTTPYIVKSIDGVSAMTSQFKTWMERGQLDKQVGARGVVLGDSAGRYREYIGSTEGERLVIVNHRIMGRQGDATWRTNADALKKLYRRKKAVRVVVLTRHGVDVRAYVVLARLLPHETLDTAQGEWQLLDSALYADATATANDSDTASPLTVALANAGNEDCWRATYTLKATAARAAAAGHPRAYPITLANRSPRQLNDWPIDFADDDVSTAGIGGYDHAADVVAGHSMAAGYDVELWGAGRRFDMWWGPTGLGVPNNATAALWANVSLPPAMSWTLAEAVGAAGQTALVVNGRLLAPPEVPFLIMSVGASTTHEVMRVTAHEYNGDGTTTLTVVRGARGTSALAAIAVGGTLWWAAGEFWLLIGQTGLTAFKPRDETRKPMLLESLALRSHNQRHIFEAFCECEASGYVNDRLPRAGAWRIADRATDCPHERERKDADGDMYTRWIPRTATLSADAAIGTALAIVYHGDGAIEGHPLASRWEHENPIGVAGTSGLTFDYNAASLENNVALEGDLIVVGEDGDGNVVLLAEYERTSATAQTITPTGRLYLIAFAVRPYDPKLDNYADVAASDPDANLSQPRGWTVDNGKLLYDPSRSPVPVWGAKQSIYQFGRPGAPVTIANADGDTLELRGLIVDLNAEVTIDVQAGTIVDADGVPRSGWTAGDIPPVPAGPDGTVLTVTDPAAPGNWYAGATWRSAWN